MMYTYNQILKIKNELNSLIGPIESRGLPMIAEGKHLREHIKQYDVLLNHIGVNGICMDPSLCKGLFETENFIKLIKEKL